MANAVTGDITHIEIDETPAWSIDILGKRLVTRKIPFGPVVMKEFQRYLVVRGLSPALSQLPESTPLIAKLPVKVAIAVDADAADPAEAQERTIITEEAITESAIYKILRRFFKVVGPAYDGDPAPNAAFEKTSTHWFVHKFA